LDPLAVTTPGSRFEQVEWRIDTMVNRIVAAVVIALGVLFGALHYWPPHG
jgi:hypothetical protein